MYREVVSFEEEKMVNQPTRSQFQLTYGDEQGLRLSWEMPDGRCLAGIPVRVRLHGAHTFGAVAMQVEPAPYGFRIFALTEKAR